MNISKWGWWKAMLGLLPVVGGAPWLPLAAEPPGAPAHNRYNVLFIVSDDLRPELGCYGYPLAQTPSFDRFASQGVTFTRAYCQVPTCGASRYATLTGRNPFYSGVTSGNTGFYEGRAALLARELAGAQSLPELFRRSGYHTVEIGKFSHTPDGRVYEYDGSGDGRPELPNAWDQLATPYGPWQRGWTAFFAHAGGRSREPEGGPGGRDKGGMEFLADKDTDLPDGLMADAAVEQLRSLRHGAQPFFLAVGFYKPHLPFVATRGDWDAFAGVNLPPPASPGKIDSRYWNNSSEFYGYSFPFPKTRPLSVSAAIETRRAYFACARYTDRQVGKVLAALEETGLADTTIVVVWSDNGWHLGEQDIWGKKTPFEMAARIVLMMRVPGLSHPGLVTRALVESTDIYPTLVDLCAPRFSRTQYPLAGASLRGLLDGSRTSIRNEAITYWADAVSLRTDAYRFIGRRLGDNRVVPLELYDLSGDLTSGVNLIKEKPAVVREMTSLLRQRLPVQVLPVPARPEPVQPADASRE